MQATIKAIEPHLQTVINHFASQLPSEWSRHGHHESIDQLIKLVVAAGRDVETHQILKDHVTKFAAKLNLTPQDLERVYAALISTLSFFFERDWTKKVEDEWRTFFAYVTSDVPYIESAMPVRVELIETVCTSQTLADALRLHIRDLIDEAIRAELKNAVNEDLRQHIRSLVNEAIKQEINQVRSLF